MKVEKFIWMGRAMDGSEGKSNTQRAVDELRDMIFRGELAPGSDHLEGELAEKLGMSRTPIREAALMLEAQGLVALRPRKGLRVMSVSPQDMADIYDVLTELESLAAARAADEGYLPADLAKLRSAIDDMDFALKKEDREAWSAADDRFHRELVRLGGNKRVQVIVAMMEDQVRRAKIITLHMRPLPVRSNDDHRALLEAIASGDAVRARHIHKVHRTEARKVLLALLETHSLKHL